MEIAQALCIVFAVCILSVDSLMFHLTSSQNYKKCLREEIHKDVLVTGDYELSAAPGHKTNLGVNNPIQSPLYCLLLPCIVMLVF
jgi:hypothetical protein